jgi:diaminopimelate decarboxylase
VSYRLKNHQWVMQTTQGDMPLSDLVTKHNQPFYVYNLEDAVARAQSFLRSGNSIHYAMKANSDVRLLRELARLGLGVDVVSVGELQKALRCGFSPQRVIFSGVAKDREELSLALQEQIFQINVESFEELQLLNQICGEKQAYADVALRLNIHLSAPTHQHVQTTTPESKFGLDLAQLPEILAWARDKKWVRIKGIATHIGSQIEDLSVFAAMARQMGDLYQELSASGLPLERLDLGGGLGINYHEDGADDVQRAELYLKTLAQAHGTGARILIEPGRFLVARMGVLLARVIYVKKTSAHNFMILNAGMNCLMRPALYQAYHRISPIHVGEAREKYTVVGPICESTDKFAVDREMSSVQRGDWVAVLDAGAYGATMANTYNESPLPQQWSWLDGQWEVR